MKPMYLPSMRCARLWFAALAVAGMASMGTAARAEGIDTIKTKGTLTVGVQAEFPPWGSIDASGSHVGYDVDVARLMAQDLGVKLSLVAVTAANRVAYLTTGKVDVLAAAVGMYPERAKAVQFSKPYATLDGVVYGRKTETIRDFTDLAKLRVGSSRGSAADTALTKGLPPGTPLQRFDDEAAPIQALLSGQIDAAGSTNLMSTVLARTPTGSAFEAKFTFARQYNGMATLLGDKSLNAWLNAFVDRNTANGKLNAISRQWIGSDLPPMPDTLPDVPFVAR